MKKLLLLLVFISASLFSQVNPEKKISSKVSEVVVFLESAQVTRKKTITINKGITELKFIKLSPFVVGKSIQVKSTNDVEIQAVNFEKNYLEKQIKNPKLIKLENDLITTQKKIEIQNTYLNINQEEIKFLQSNRNIGGKNQILTATNLKNAATYYGGKYKALKLESLNIKEKLRALYNSVSDIKNQIGNFTSKKEFATGEIVVKLKTNTNTTISLELTYNVGNAGWFPSYDIRVNNINSPLSLVYKANVKQNTKVDWNNVKLRFSSADPSISSEAPELKTHFLNYNSVPPIYKRNIATVSGIITDKEGPLPGVSVLVKGTTIGTETDFDGYYSITLPKDANTISFSYLGFKTEERFITSSNISLRMKEDSNTLDEVVVTGYGKKKSVDSALKGRVSGIQIGDKKNNKPKYSIPTKQIVNQTTVNFEINSPYTLKSNTKNYIVGMKTYDVYTDYQYYTIPKINKNAFLIAFLTDWEKLNLLEGEANIYFEGTYIGKSLLDTRFTEDKLKISLGKDKNVVINREKIKDFTTKQFIGNKKQENKAWKISIKNNKSQNINISVFDQIPISTLEEIKVEYDKSNTGNLNNETGEVLWKLNLSPNNIKSLLLKYSIKYPKKKKIILE
ncbi:MAG: mucoidy inhibitor MuiA family protein [Flavobacteriaceae bacterium]|nr:mucoidy inhibitor MuiA family protein [Flavobacteriaceae bacterium]